MEPQVQQQLQQLVNVSQKNFQKGIDALQKGLFPASALFFNLSARENDKLSELIKELPWNMN